MRRRQLAIRAAAVGAGALLVVYLVAPWLLARLGEALVNNQPPQKADAVIVLAGDAVGNRILKGVELVQQGFAPVIYVSGPEGYYGHSEDQLAIEFALKRGHPSQWFVGVPNHAESTLDEARIMLPILRAKGVRRVLLVTSNFHTARAARIFRRIATPGMEIVSVAAKDASFAPQGWWNNRRGQKVFFYEASKTFADYVGL